jgi:hypothetical protein
MPPHADEDVRVPINPNQSLGSRFLAKPATRMMAIPNEFSLDKS